MLLSAFLAECPGTVPQPEFPCWVGGAPHILTAALENTCVVQPARPGGDSERCLVRYDQIEVEPESVRLAPAPPKQRLWRRPAKAAGEKGERQRRERRAASDERARRDQEREPANRRPSVRPTGEEEVLNSEPDEQRPLSDIAWLTQELEHAQARMADLAGELSRYRGTPVVLTPAPAPAKLAPLLDVLVRTWAQEDDLAREAVDRRREARQEPAIFPATGYNKDVNSTTRIRSGGDCRTTRKGRRTRRRGAA